MLDIWVVEDHPDMQALYSDLINGSDDMICTHVFGNFDDCSNALKSANISKPNILLLDIGLPGISGLDALTIIKSEYPKIHIIIQTVFEDNDKIFRAICSGASGYLLKKSAGDEILKGIREVSKGGASINAQIAKKVLTMFSNFVQPSADYNLTEREKEILNLLVSGSTSKMISEKLGLSYYTAATHVKNIYTKLQVNSRGGAVAKALKENLI